MHIPFEASAHVKNMLNNIGRTEDLAFSPDNRRLAIAAYSQNMILMLDIEISTSSDQSRIFIRNCYEILSEDLNLPHGITWIDNKTLIVGNRFGQTVVLALPETQVEQKQLQLAALQVLPPASDNKQHSNDCVAISPIGQDLYEVLVCSNSGNYVASHILDGADNFSVIAESILLDHKIQIPDGVAFSPDGRWIAVSNHTTQSVYIYENVKSLNPASEPCAVLPGITYPHGITFTGCAQFLFVAAAGDPFIYGYHNPTGEWQGEYQPFTKFKSLDDETFKRGSYNKQEGGTKGICFAHNTNILAMTCNEQPLAFADMTALMSDLEYKTVSTSRTVNSQKNPTDYLQRTIQCMKVTQSQLMKLHSEDMRAVLSSTSWKITRPLRVLKRSLGNCVYALRKR